MHEGTGRESSVTPGVTVSVSSPRLHLLPSHRLLYKARAQPSTGNSGPATLAPNSVGTAPATGPPWPLPTLPFSHLPASGCRFSRPPSVPRIPSVSCPRDLYSTVPLSGHVSVPPCWLLLQTEVSVNVTPSNVPTTRAEPKLSRSTWQPVLLQSVTYLCWFLTSVSFPSPKL